MVSDLGGAAVALSMLAAALLGIIGIVVGLSDDRPNAAFFGGGLAVGITTGAVLMQRAHDRRRASSVEAQRGYQWVEATYTYSIDSSDRQAHTQVVDVKIRATRNGVDLFSNQYRWSGSGADLGPVVQSDGHSLVGALRRELGWRSYVVSLSPVLQKGQTTTVSILQRFTDNERRFEPFLAKAVHESMERLTLRVQLPLALRPARVWRVARDGAGPEARVIERANTGVSDNGLNAVIEWGIPHPGLGINYELYWDYGNGQGIYDIARNETDTDRPPV